MRTIVIADIHGQPHLLENAIVHSGYDPDEDRLIIAGDMFDIGKQVWTVMKRAEELGAEVLVGNHESALPTNLQITPQNPESWEYAGLVQNKILQGEWKLAAHAEGVLITHAGVSKDFNTAWDLAPDLESFVEHLNGSFIGEITRAVEARQTPYQIFQMPILGESGPLWYRPDPQTLLRNGPKQIAGHTPEDYYRPRVQNALRERGCYLIDPYSRKTDGDAGNYVYAVIENGEVTVHKHSDSKE